jgi:hypothetical protein
MRTVRLSGSYQADAPLILPSYTRLVLDGSIDALPYKLGWTNESAGPANQTASMVSVKDAHRCRTLFRLQTKLRTVGWQ